MSEKPRGVHLATLPPHEFTDHGEPTWNVNPRVEVKGTKVIIGFSHSKRYSVGAEEAFQLARALIEAATYANPKSKKESTR